MGAAHRRPRYSPREHRHDGASAMNSMGADQVPAARTPPDHGPHCSIADEHETPARTRRRTTAFSRQSARLRSAHHVRSERCAPPAAETKRYAHKQLGLTLLYNVNTM